jgi:hypothetical protein
MLPRRRCPFCRRWFHPHPRLKQRQKTFRYRLFFRPDFLPSFLLSFNRAFLFYFSLFFRRMFGLFLHKLFAGGETYAPKKEVSFLSSLVSSPSAAQGAAKDLWSTRMPPGAEAQVQSEMAEQAPRLLSRYLCTSKRKVRNAYRGKASLSRAASRLLTAQRSFRSKLAPATETSACKSHKF